MTERAGRGKSASTTFDEKYMFGSEEEKLHRIDDGYTDEDNPANNSPSFKQIDGALTGKDMNNPEGETKSGDFKFSGGV